MTQRTLLNFIGFHESRNDYNAVWGGIAAADRPRRALSSMTIRQVLAWQDSIDGKYRSEAAGCYQMLEDTLRDLPARAGVHLDDPFDAQRQDALATALLKRRGLDDYLDGRITAEAFANALAQEWASLPVVMPVVRTDRKTGRRWTVQVGASYYSGDGLNRAQVGVAPFLAAVRAIKPAAAPRGFWATLFEVLFAWLGKRGAQ